MKPMYISFMKLVIQSLCLWITISKAQNNHNDGNSAGKSVGHSYFFYQQPDYPRDCKETLSQCSAANSSGVFLIKPDGYPDAFEVYCNDGIDGGGWTVVHRRTDGAIDFNRGWKEYTKGFGFLSSEFWLGLDKLSFLTHQNIYEIRIDMENTVGSSFYVHYNRFRISDEWSDFRITDVGQYSGTASSFINACPTNMEYGNCRCQASCEDPENTMECQTACSEEETCICQEGFLRKGDNCVPPGECSCFLEGEGVISVM
ncbi:Fibrinogen-like protein A [Holothuria leucospilota]|uniref:Fibrinogen-like protein A n=1 Tax=Holothuria leucospilota TaxID=206669 RepID=A0A9Q1BVQ1_HOLLE|nr:Fibrinogen-like protein A [Holothuria leucospilota]